MAAPSEYNKVEYFSNVKPNLFKDVIGKFMDHGMSMDMTQPEGEHNTHQGMEGMDMSHAKPLTKGPRKKMFGKLTLDAVPYHEPIIMVTVAAIIIGGAALVGLITYFGKWSYLWNEWLTSVDHKNSVSCTASSVSSC